MQGNGGLTASRPEGLAIARGILQFFNTPRFDNPGPPWWKRVPAAASARRRVPASQPNHLSSRDSPRICPETGLRLRVHSFRKKVRDKRDKRDKSLLMRWPADPSSVFRLVSPVRNGTIILATRQALMSAPSTLRRPCHLASDGLEPVSGPTARRGRRCGRGRPRARVCRKKVR